MDIGKTSRALFIIGWLSAVILLTMLSDFMALHDVYNDYVSEGALRQVAVNITSALPDWAMADKEWLWIRIMFFIRLTAILGIIAVLIRTFQVLPRKQKSS